MSTEQFEPHRLSENDLRQCLRIAGGGSLGLLICKVFNLEYGAFFCVYPMLILGLVPTLNAHLVRQFLAQGVVVSLEVGVLYGLLVTDRCWRCLWCSCCSCTASR